MPTSPRGSAARRGLWIRALHQNVRAAAGSPRSGQGPFVRCERGRPHRRYRAAVARQCRQRAPSASAWAARCRLRVPQPRHRQRTGEARPGERNVNVTAPSCWWATGNSTGASASRRRKPQRCGCPVFASHIGSSLSNSCLAHLTARAASSCPATQSRCAGGLQGSLPASASNRPQSLPPEFQLLHGRKST